MPLGKEVDLGPGDTVLDGDPAPQWKGAQQDPPTPRKGAEQPLPHFSAHVYCGQTVAHLSNS